MSDFRHQMSPATEPTTLLQGIDMCARIQYMPLRPRVKSKAIMLTVTHQSSELKLLNGDEQ
jgi:hypothetical protein